MKKFLLTFSSIAAAFVFILLAVGSGGSDSKPDKDAWYVGGTLHKSTSEEWQSATYKNKLATCADFVANIKKVDGASYSDWTPFGNARADAEEMLACIDETVRDSDVVLKLNEVASMCAISLGL